MEKLWYIDREMSNTTEVEEVSAGRMNAVAKMLDNPYRILGNSGTRKKIRKSRYFTTMNVPISEETVGQMEYMQRRLI